MEKTWNFSVFDLLLRRAVIITPPQKWNRRSLPHRVGKHRSPRGYALALRPRYQSRSKNSFFPPDSTRTLDSSFKYTTPIIYLLYVWSCMEGQSLDIWVNICLGGSRMDATIYEFYTFSSLPKRDCL